MSTAAGDRSTHDHKGQAHAGHAHVSSDTNARRLSIALALIVGFMAVEVVAGILAHSLRLVLGRGAHAHGRWRDRAVGDRLEAG